MNFLAHLYFAENDGRSMIGNLMPDMVRGKLPDDLEHAVRRGVETHRLIDRLTDTHPKFIQSKSRLVPNHHLFAGILVDIFYDHILANHWADYHDVPLHDFARRTYDQILAHRSHIPERMQSAIDGVIANDSLRGYATVEGMTNTMHRLEKRFSRRFRRTIDPDKAMHDMLEHRDDMRHEFNEVFATIFEQVLPDQTLHAGRHLPPAKREIPAAIPKTT